MAFLPYSRQTWLTCRWPHAAPLVWYIVVYVRYIDEQVPIRYDGAVFPNLGCSNCWLKESGFCCPGYVRLIWSCGTGIRVFLKIISMSYSYKGVPMLHAQKHPRHAHSSQYLHCLLAWVITTQSHTQPNVKFPLWPKKLLYGIGLPLHVPLPHAIWMIPQMGVLCDGMRLVLQAPNRLYISIKLLQ